LGVTKMLAPNDGCVIRSQTIRCSGATITLPILEDYFPITQNKYYSKYKEDLKKYISQEYFIFHHVNKAYIFYAKNLVHKIKSYKTSLCRIGMILH
jgi:hypothetical protein